jgi:hypothetical protein
MAVMNAHGTLKRWEPQTVRTFVICVAGKLLTGGRQLCVKRPRKHLHRKLWEDWVALCQIT